MAVFMSLGELEAHKDSLTQGKTNLSSHRYNTQHDHTAQWRR
jgi:hypothetical protein